MWRADKRGAVRAVTIKDVAKEAGVAPITVSRVVNGESNVLPTTRAQVQAAVEKLRYVPNRAAQSLVGANSLRIGLLLGNPSPSFLGILLAGSLDEANRLNAHLIVAQPQEGDAAADAVRSLLASGVSGVIVPAPACDDPAVVETIQASGLPSAAIATCRPPSGWSAVSIDEHRAAFEMTRYILELGHRRIGFIAGFDHPVSERRLAGYRDALAGAGIALDDKLIGHGLYTYRSGLEAASWLLNLANRPTAIFASNDDMAAAAVAVAHSQGLRVPNDLAVCGFDDTALAMTIWPELTTVHQPIREMSQAAVIMLTERIRAGRAGKQMPAEHVLLNFCIKCRGSSA